jgi:hypothetical protein
MPFPGDIVLQKRNARPRWARTFVFIIELEDAEAKRSARTPSPVHILEFVPDDDMDGLVTKLGGEGRT